jgi:hypothetical protein
MKGFTPGQVRMTLPDDSAVRKQIPMYRGLLKYFPAALAGAASHSQGGNDKHNPGEELHHARGKSGDHGDCIIRHMVDIADMLASNERGQHFTADMILAECNALVWRACAFSQEIHETIAGAPMAPAARASAPVVSTPAAAATPTRCYCKLSRYSNNEPCDQSGVFCPQRVRDERPTCLKDSTKRCDVLNGKCCV